MSIVNGSTSAVVQQQHTSNAHRKDSVGPTFAQAFQNATSACSAQPGPSAPAPATPLPPPFSVSSDDPYSALNQMLNKFVAQCSSQINVLDIMAAVIHLKHQLSSAGVLPSQIDPTALFTQIIEKATEFDENSAGGSSPGKSPLRQELAQFLGQGGKPVAPGASFGAAFDPLRQAAKAG